MSDATKAVFLSYAREDTDAARRIADALRSHGVEVWFDQSEPRGGDAWDAKIRKQINDCALFLPIISANTQGRGKGYFRLEWKLAVEQTHLMAEGMAFLAPVVIDDTPEGGALVPPEFMKVQWTRLPGALPTPQFVEQVKRLLEAPRKAVGPVGDRAPDHRSGLQKKPGIPGWTWGALTAVVVGIAVALSVSRKSEPASAPPKTAVEPKPAVPAAPLVDAKSIAVLPFENLSAESGSGFFVDGVHDEVITALARIHDLKVISRTSVMAYRDPAGRNLKKIAAELGVATVLEGSVQRVGNQVHLNAQLIDARTDVHLWADTFNGDAGDIFALQASLAQKIAAALKATLTPDEKTLIERRPTENQEAYELYLRARTMQQEQGEQGSREDFERVIGVYEQAVARDPSFALAHAQVALVHSVMYWFGFLDPTPERAAKMKAAVDAAVRLAPDAPETHLALGAYHYRVERDWNQALSEFTLAKAGLPNDAQLFFWLAVTHRRLGHWTQSLGFFEQSVSLNPRDLAPVTNYVQFLAELRRWPQTRAAINRFLAYFPTERVLLESQAQLQFVLTGDRVAYARAFTALPHQPSDPTGVGDLYFSYLLLGDYAAADRALTDARVAALAGRTVINDPIAFYRAFLAFCHAGPDVARDLADQAIASYRGLRWNARQQAWVQMRIAMAEAWAGRRDEAVRDGQAALADMSARDAYDAVELREMLGEIYVAVGQREDAIASLRLMMNEPCNLSPNEIRIHPLWSRLKDDPRFEEILHSAKPL